VEPKYRRKQRSTVKISLQELTDLSKSALSKYGYPEDEAAIILDMLMYAQTRGNNQGIVKLIDAGMPRHEKAQTPTIEQRQAVDLKVILSIAWSNQYVLDLSDYCNNNCPFVLYEQLALRGFIRLYHLLVV